MPTFPLPIPALTRVNVLNSLETALPDFEAFIKDHIALVILNTFENSKILLEGANKLCTQETANPKQRVLWLNSVEQVVALKPTIEAAIKKAFPDKEIAFDNVRAFAMMPEVTYVIYVDPSLSSDPKDKRKKISIFQMSRAFNSAIKALPTDTSTESQEV